MALYYTVNFRGTILSSVFNVPMHVRIVSGLSGADEAEICKKMAEGMSAQWEAVIKPIVSLNCNLVKTVVQAYQSEIGFYEYTHFVAGAIDGQDMPTYVAFGFRQNRTNILFRASKHAIPGAVEENNLGGSFAFTGAITTTKIADAGDLFNAPSSITALDSSSGVVQPVLIRTQNTVVDPVTHDKTVTFFDPHQISDVGGGTFYGWTSQVSRKRIISSS